MDVPLPKRTARQQQALERREQILSTALKLFGQQGYSATTTKQIAQAAGITEGLIFRYFPTKVSLLQAIAKDRDPLAQAFHTIFSKSDELPVATVLEQIALAWMEVTRTEMDFMSMLLSESQINPELRTTLQDSIEEAVTALAHILQARAQTGEIRPDLPFRTAAANFFAALLLFFIMHRQLDDAQWTRQADSFISELLDTWLYGASGVQSQPKERTV